MSQETEEDKQKEQIFNQIADEFKKQAKTQLKYGDGIITAYTFEDERGNDLIELQTDFGDHLDLLVILNGKPFSIGGDYVHGVQAWVKFSHKAVECLRTIFQQRTATEEVWYRGNQRIGGVLYIPSATDSDKFRLIDRTGKALAFFASSKQVDHVLRLKTDTPS